MIMEILEGLGLFLGFYAAAVALLLGAGRLWKAPRELLRKTLHMVCVLSSLVLIYWVQSWQAAMMVACLFAFLVYPVLMAVERFTGLMKLLPQRKGGEFRSSLVLVFVMFAFMILIFRGVLGEDWAFVATASIMGWGFGDASAALVGKAVGKHKVAPPWGDNAKTFEGTLAMTCVCFLAILSVLLLTGVAPWPLCLVAALLAALAAAAAELISRQGLDTLIVPLVTAAALFGFFTFFG